MTLDVSRICRTCLSLTPLLSLYETKGKLSVADMLMDITSLKLDAKDEMPAKICLACLSEINRSYTFKLKCENSDATLRNLLFQNDVMKNEESGKAQECEESLKDDEIKLLFEVITNTSKKTDKNNWDDDNREDNCDDEEEAEEVVAEHYDNEGFDEDIEEAIEKEIDYNGENIEPMVIEKVKESEDEFDEGEEKVEDNNTHREYYVVDENVEGQNNENEVNVYPRIKRKRKTTKNDQEVYYINIQKNSERNESNKSPVEPQTPAKKSRKLIKCKFCTMDFVFPRNLNKHIAKFHSEELCSKLTIETKDSDSGELTLVIDEPAEPSSNANDNNKKVISNTTTESDELPNFKFSCEKCGAGFVAEKSLKYHVKYNKCTQKPYTCSQCEKVFINAEKLAMHKLTHKIHSCDKCHQVFTDVNNLQKHVAEVHKSFMRNQCPQCDKVFSMSSTLKDHMRVHSGEKPFLCTTCGKGFTQNTNLRQHMMRHEQIKPFACTHCSDSFVSKGELNSHMRKHTGDHPFVCKICKKSFTTSSALVKHRRVHTGERPYSCDLCPMRFSALNTLKNHRRTHTGEKPFRCPYCTQAFAQKSDCGIHIRTHTGERPYNCTECGAAFQQSGTLLMHMRRHGAEKKSNEKTNVETDLITCVDVAEQLEDDPEITQD